MVAMCEQSLHSNTDADALLAGQTNSDSHLAMKTLVILVTEMAKHA